MAIIRKKVWKEYFEDIISGKKKLELRLGDFEVNEGNILVLEEWDKDTKEYTGRKAEVIATYILKTKGQTFWSEEEVKKHGFQIIQFVYCDVGDLNRFCCGELRNLVKYKNGKSTNKFACKTRALGNSPKREGRRATAEKT